MLLVSRFTSQKLKPFIVRVNQEDLLVLTELVEAGKIKPVIERRYALRHVADALRHVGEGHAQGQTVIQIVD
jgi:NADPH:quinone reductase-like Zn-dependent oxidoreductase